MTSSVRRPWSVGKCSPAAIANFMARSAVIGSVLARPRMPSVPNSERTIRPFQIPCRGPLIADRARIRDLGGQPRAYCRAAVNAGRLCLFPGWKVVATAFLVALYGWGLGFYGAGVSFATLAIVGRPCMDRSCPYG